MARRHERVGELLRAELADLLRKEIRDPRLQRLVSVTGVDVTPDLKLARVYVSVLGDEADKREALRGLARAAGYLRTELAQRVDLRRTPELQFKLDESIERGMRILELLKEVAPSPSPPPSDHDRSD
ncbi:MAG: 30S ribosome-binding factor RbfA [Chloroflexi bacterium]|nr:30S ribosome-binding factor RbfA [Chloroflexota bacterium]